MKSRGKRFFKRLVQIGKIPFLIGLGMIFGLAISGSSNSAHHSYVINSEHFGSEIAENIEHRIEERIERQIEERIINEIVIPPIPAIPDIPEIPEIPDFSEIHTNVHVEHTPSFWDILNGIGTIMASLMLIGLGGMMLIRRRQQPQEKSPESVDA